MRNRFSILALLLTTFCARSLAGVNDAIAACKKNVGLQIFCDSVFAPGNFKITYRLPSDAVQIETYLQLLNREYAKYPAGYLAHLGLKQIVLASNLKLDSQWRTAIPDPSSQTLYLEIESPYGVQDSGYLIHVLHHELHHYAEYYLWHNMYYPWRKWKFMNPIGFKYMGAGSMAYANKTINWYALNHPRKGFMNMYATTAAEEDRCEIVALLMTGEGQKLLQTYFTLDGKLRRKTIAISKLLNQISGQKDNYWMEQVKRLKG